MARFNYKLRKSKLNGATIQLVFSYGTGKRLRYSTGLKVQDIKNWDVRRMRIKTVVGELDRVYINDRLTDLERYFFKEYNKLTIKDDIKPTNENLTEICDIFFHKNQPAQEQEKLELLPFFYWFKEHYKTNPLMTTGSPMKKTTYKTYNNAYNLLKRFSDKKYKVTYDKINVQFYHDFLEWLSKNNYSTNYIGTQIKILKTILTAGLELGHHNSTEHTKKYFKKPTEQIDNIYLTDEELLRIFNLDLGEVKPIKISKSLYLTKDKLDVARDLFLISANTGLRVSDFNKLKKENIVEADGRSYFQIIIKKNNRPLTIPINSIVKKILDKRDGHPPKGMPDQHINYALKQLGKLAEINTMENVTRTIGGKKTSEMKPKYDLITNHTGRRSFCTNAYFSGMPTIDIMAISGHSTEKVFYNYIKADDFQRAKKIGEHLFFKK
ncbi:phage integrase SAM-like domain-containing protein [Mangrovimonas futianensis]|uniref:phage integrase SAM-like domain-containing protein n=1 Tax=Mangrovimonas futianensis TaxID=2895523 RepID=UPI001E46C16B|nr:phage integrase SAM-like domain-containing protein [Mangrovimonas futianensis]MCF1420432.1 site-specific integrase [Mangrovimonas futianensis]